MRPRFVASAIIARSTSDGWPTNLVRMPCALAPRMNVRTARGESCQPGGFGSLSAATSFASSSAYRISAGGRWRSSTPLACSGLGFFIASSQALDVADHFRHDHLVDLAERDLVAAV